MSKWPFDNSFQNNELLAAMIIGLVIGLAIGITVYIFYCLNLSKALKQCAPFHQRMKPGQVWLIIIPIFGPIWHFFVVTRVAESLAAEFHARNLPVEEEKPGYKIGIAYCVLSVSSYIQYTGIPLFKTLAGLAGLAGFICFIIYWVRIARYRKRLEEHRFQFGQGSPFPFPSQFPGSPQG